LVARNLKLRYRNSWFGVLWTVLLPAGSALIYYFVFNFVLKVKTPNFLAFVVLGTLVWAFVASSITGGMDSLVQNRNLLNKVALPPQALVYAEIISCLLNLIFALPVIAIVFMAYHIGPTLNFLILPLIGLYLLGQMIGLGLILGISFVFFRDLKHMITIVLQAWFYLTPVLYSLDRWPEKYRWAAYLNPLTFIFDELQKAALGSGIPNWQHLGVSGAWSIFLLVTGLSVLLIYRHKMIELL
jgi:ABC-type polysaccharide/polyol phosphate export permease